MESLKPLADLLKPDERQPLFSVLDGQSGAFRALTLEDIYQRAAAIHLHDGVPEVIRSHFASAQNLVAYSWFYYPFNVTAQLLGYVSVEAALKIKYADDKQSFRTMVQRAVRERLVQDEGFSHIRARDERAATLEGEWLRQLQWQLQPYVEVLAESMPRLRNALAHGAHAVHMNGATHVRICAEFINQIFPATDKVER